MTDEPMTVAELEALLEGTTPAVWNGVEYEQVGCYHNGFFATNITDVPDGWDRIYRRVAPSEQCPASNTRPDPELFSRGYYNDGGFHHCACGATVEWIDGLVSAHDLPRDAALIAATPDLAAALIAALGERDEAIGLLEEWIVWLNADGTYDPDGERHEAVTAAFLASHPVGPQPEDG